MTSMTNFDDVLEKFREFVKDAPEDIKEFLNEEYVVELLSKDGFVDSRSGDKKFTMITFNILDSNPITVTKFHKFSSVAMQIRNALRRDGFKFMAIRADVYDSG